MKHAHRPAHVIWPAMARIPSGPTALEVYESWGALAVAARLRSPGLAGC